MRYISIDSAQPGMIVGKSIYNEQGSILVNYRVKLTERLISRMRDIGLAGLYLANGEVQMKGPATTVFDGEIDV